MKQCMVIHGGETFDTEEQYYSFLEGRELDPLQPTRLKRRNRLHHAMSHEYQVFLPQMPNAQQATYKAWKIWFEKYIPYLQGETLVLIGHSLGGWFLCKWLSEHTLPQKITQLHLVAACVSADGVEGEGSADFDFNHAGLARLQEQCDEIFLYHSRDDDIVPYAQAELIASYLPKAHLQTFLTRGHFLQPALPELLENIRVYQP